MMDNVVDVSGFPLDEQTHEARAKRRIGLGVTGLADALILCNVRYGSARAVELTESWLKAIEREAYLASTELAAEKGAFPLFDKERYLAGETTPRSRCRRARGNRTPRHPQFAPHVSGTHWHDLDPGRQCVLGLEPVFSFRYTRNVLMPDGTRARRRLRTTPTGSIGV